MSVPQSQITHSRAKKIQEALNAFIQESWSKSDPRGEFYVETQERRSGINWIQINQGLNLKLINSGVPEKGFGQLPVTKGFVLCRMGLAWN